MITLPALHPMIPEMVRVTRVTREIEGVFSWHLDVSARPGGFSFAPGQFNMLYVPGLGEVPISISGDAEKPAELFHTIRAVGAVTQAMQALKKGAKVGLRGPFGSAWPLAEMRGRDVVIVAGGLGLAPLRPAILHLFAHRAEVGKVVVLYGARTPADILFQQEIERWRGRLDADVEVTVDRAERGWRGDVGVVPSLVGRAKFDPANAIALLCGPEVMMRFTVRELERLGVPDEAIWVSMERNMKCGAGLCGHCQYGPTFVCKDGPVYRYDRIARLFRLREI